MSEFYLPINSVNYELCQPDKLHTSYDEIIEISTGASSTRAASLNIIRSENGKKFLKSDAPWLGSHVFFFRRKVIQAMSDVLLKFGRILEIDCSDSDVIMYVCDNVINGLDEKRSSIEYFKSGRILSVDKYVFRDDLADNIDLLRLEIPRVSPIFISIKFVEMWTKYGFVGLDFQKI